MSVGTMWHIWELDSTRGPKLQGRWKNEKKHSSDIVIAERLFETRSDRVFVQFMHQV